MACNRLEGVLGHGIAISIAIFALSVVGCRDSGRPKVVPVEGKVLYNGKPLEFGVVAFQPSRGQPAMGIIRPDGTFTLATYRPEDGVPLGHHKVRISCYSSQDPKNQPPPDEQVSERPIGTLFIPRKYTVFDRSGLTAEVVDVCV